MIDLSAGTRAHPVALARYDVVGKLGRGGMGTVYEALDRERNTRVALKTLSVSDPAAAARLKREFRMVADMSHPSLAPVYELVEVDGFWFFTMECIDGVSFNHWARREHPTREVTPEYSMSRTLHTTLVADAPTECESVESQSPSAFAPTLATPPRRSLDEIRRGLLDIVGGVSALHEVGLFHGDLKPSNVLVREDGRAVVVDFGLSGQVGRAKTLSNMVAGTPAYMPPEQLCGLADGGPSTDWYAFGVLLYRVLTGLFPWTQESLLDLLFHKRHHVPQPPAAMLDLPGDLSDLCMALMDPEPEQRPGTEQILEVLSGSAPSPISVAAPVRSERRAEICFVGRERELCDLERAYGSARGGRMILVHTHGTSGIGKSALLDSFVRGVQELDGALLLRGRCYERENVPYKAFDRIVDELAEHLQDIPSYEVEELLPEWSAELGTVFPALLAVNQFRDRVEKAPSPVDAMERRRRAWGALSDLLKALRRDRPIVLSIDDLQWADADSAKLLVELIGSSEPPALLLIVSYRPEAAENPELRPYFEQSARLSAAGALVDLELDALLPSEARELARATLERIGESASDDRVSYVAKEAGGVPFFIEELANFVAAGEGLHDGVTLEQAIRSRIGSLPDQQRALMETIAIAGSPLPQSLVFEAASVDAKNLPELLALRRASLVSWLGAGGDDAVFTYHDRIRQSVVASLDEEARQAVHLALGRALARRHERDSAGSWVFEALNHLGAASRLLADEAERLAVARLSLEAARRAREAAAFPLAFRCFDEGLKLLPEDPWEAHYELALELHVGAAETAYLSAEWEALDRRIDEVKAHARSAMDQMAVWEVEVDAHAGKQQYAAAVDAGIRALSLLGVHLPSDPDEAEVGDAVKKALEQLNAIGPEAFARLDDVSDPEMLAAMRIGVRVSPAAYFNRPLLLPVIASKLIGMSIDKGLSNATPYALALFGIVLNTLEMFPLSHEWGRLALRLLDRYPDRTLEAATRHVLQNLVCNWMVPLSSTLKDLREVFDIGCRTGDYEYASYAAHGYVHNSIYAARPLEPLLAEALELGKQMRALGAVNAVHVHAPFEQLIKALTGKLERPWCLDDDSFDEQTSLAEAEATDSRSGLFVHHYIPGLARYMFGRQAEAADFFARARRYQDAVPSIWHNPIIAQFSVLAACAKLETTTDEAERALLREVAETGLATLTRLASHHAWNFAHRVSLVQGEIHRVEGDRAAALAWFEKSIEQAGESGWINDKALAHELAARCHDDASAARKARRAARAAYAAWGATAKVAELQAQLEGGD